MGAWEAAHRDRGRASLGFEASLALRLDGDGEGVAYTRERDNRKHRDIAEAPTGSAPAA